MHKSKLVTDCGNDLVCTSVSFVMVLAFATDAPKVVARIIEQTVTVQRKNEILEYIFTAYMKLSQK